MSPYLSAFSVSDRAEVLYRRILRAGPSTLAVHADGLGWTVADAWAALQSLIALRLVRETADRLVLAEHPRTALERLIDNEQGRLEQRRRELSDARAAITAFADDHRLGLMGMTTTARPAWEIVSTQVAASMVEQVARSTSGMIRHCVRELDVGPGLDDDVQRTGRDVVAAGREQRTIYPVGALDDAHGRQFMSDWAQVGETQRVSEDPPSDFAIFGREVVLAVADWKNADADYIVIREPMLVAAFTALFDLAWSVATPVPGTSAGNTDRQLLSLLASGFKDEVIARYLGWGVRTVRRRVAALMSDLGADTRFQLGAAAERRGLLGGDRHTRR